ETCIRCRLVVAHSSDRKVLFSWWERAAAPSARTQLPGAIHECCHGGFPRNRLSVADHRFGPILGLVVSTRRHEAHIVAVRDLVLTDAEIGNPHALTVRRR